MKIITILIETSDELAEKNFQEIVDIDPSVLVSYDKGSLTVRIRNTEAKL